MLMVVLWLYIREKCVFWINLDGSSVLDGYVLNRDGNGIMVVLWKNVKCLDDYEL